MGPGFNVGIFIQKVSALGHFGPGGDFLSLGHCLVKRDIK
jgi:hypothetical protein